jgi:hypothetical protein
VHIEAIGAAVDLRRAHLHELEQQRLEASTVDGALQAGHRPHPDREDARIVDPRRLTDHVRDGLSWRGGRLLGSHAKERADARSPRVWTTLRLEVGSRPHAPQGAPSTVDGRSIEPRLSQHQGASPTTEDRPPLKAPMGSAPPTGWGRDLMDGPAAVGHLPRMSQRTALNRDQMTLERALRSAGDPPPNARRDDGGPLDAISRPQRGRDAR